MNATKNVTKQYNKIAFRLSPWGVMIEKQKVNTKMENKIRDIDFERRKQYTFCDSEKESEKRQR